MKANHILPLFLVAIFLKQLAWLSFMPLWQTPDEQAHFAQVSVMSETNSLHVPPQNTSVEIVTSERLLGTYRDNLGNNKYTYHPEFNIVYSESLVGLRENEISAASKESRVTFITNEATDYSRLYYVLSEAPYKLFDGGTLFARVFAVRFVGALSLVLLCWVVGKIGKLVFSNEKEVWALVALVGFTPMLSFVHSGVSSDTLFNLLFTVFIWRCLVLIKEGITVKELAITAAVVLLSFWTKPQANIMAFILVPLLSVMVFFQKRKDPKLLITCGVVLCLSLAGIIYRLSSGAPLIPETEKLKSLSLSSTSIIEHLLFTAHHTYREVLPWYWGVFRWLSLGLPEIVRKIMNITTFVALFGFGYYLIGELRRKKHSKTLAMEAFLLAVIGIYFAAITVFDFGFRQSHGYSFGIQGRYFFPVLVPLTIMMMLGLKKLRVTPLLQAVAMVLFNAIAFNWVMGSYYSLSFPGFFIQASQYKPHWLKLPFNFFILTSYVASLITVIVICFISLGKKTVTIKS